MPWPRRAPSWPPRAALLAAASSRPPPRHRAPGDAEYHLVIAGGHVIDPRTASTAFATSASPAAPSPRRAPGGSSRRQDDRRVRLVCDARPGGHPHARLRGLRRTTIPTRATTASTPTDLRSGSVDDHRRRGQFRMAQLRDFKRSRHRPGQDARARLPQHRRPRHARRHVRAGPRRHGVAACREVYHRRFRRSGVSCNGMMRKRSEDPEFSLS